MEYVTRISGVAFCFISDAWDSLIFYVLLVTAFVKSYKCSSAKLDVYLKQIY